MVRDCDSCMLVLWSISLTSKQASGTNAHGGRSYRSRGKASVFVLTNERCVKLNVHSHYSETMGMHQELVCITESIRPKTLFVLVPRMDAFTTLASTARTGRKTTRSPDLLQKYRVREQVWYSI